ncbi:MAG TPA: MurR/RpiR family transcriptional regulator [Anaerolineae bacterium]|nr:MurR/RpiR family transcriptional regulator [Anaerolineae bacterium]HPL28574.1 MurR/RpiR family transcriptional regulator [Anaerolineae bacterium]
MEEMAEFQRRLEERYSSLTKSEQRIASYLLANSDEAAFFTAVELAQRLEVSEATVVRFARAVGYDGFPELRRCLQNLFRVKVTPANRLQRALADLRGSQGHILAKVVAMEVEYLTEALHTVDPAEFDRAAEILLAGRTIHVFSTGPSRILADLAELRLRRFGVPTVAITESGRDVLERLLLLQPGDAVLIAGFHRITGELVAVIDQARAHGCGSVFLTDTLGATFKDRVDVVLAARRGPVSTFHSLTVPMAIINALILTVAMARPGESVAALDRLQELRAGYGLDVLGQAPA